MTISGAKSAIGVPGITIIEMVCLVDKITKLFEYAAGGHDVYLRPRTQGSVDSDRSLRTTLTRPEVKA